MKTGDVQIKRDILLACRTYKPRNLYVNDNLTPNRSKILYALRQIKRRQPGLLTGCGSVNSRVFAWYKGDQNSDKPIRINLNTWENFVIFCEKSLNVNSDDFIDASRGR